MNAGIIIRPPLHTRISRYIKYIPYQNQNPLDNQTIFVTPFREILPNTSELNPDVEEPRLLARERQPKSNVQLKLPEQIAINC